MTYSFPAPNILWQLHKLFSHLYQNIKMVVDFLLLFGLWLLAISSSNLEVDKLPLLAEYKSVINNYVLLP